MRREDRSKQRRRRKWLYVSAAVTVLAVLGLWLWWVKSAGTSKPSNNGLSQRVAGNKSTKSSREDYPYAVKLKQTLQFNTKDDRDLTQEIIVKPESGGFVVTMKMDNSEDRKFRATLENIATRKIHFIAAETDDTHTVKVNTRLKLDGAPQQWTQDNTLYLFYNNAGAICLLAPHYGRQTDIMVEYVHQDVAAADVAKRIIGRRFSVAPFKYNGEDVASAMEAGHAPPNTINDGHREGTFTTDSLMTVHYAHALSDATESYKIDQRHLTIYFGGNLTLAFPYTYKDGQLNFETVDVTYNDGKVVTWRLILY